jgi:transketolase
LLAKQPLSLRDVFMDELIAIASTDKRIVALDADVGESTRTQRFGLAYPERFFEMGIAEQNTLATAGGMAAAGLIPFTATFAVFTAMRAAEMVRTSICYPKRNVKMIGGYAGLSNGKDGATHQAIEDVAIMRGFPNLTIISPSDPVLAKKMARAAVDYQGPIYIRMEYENLPVVYPESQIFEIGKGYVLKYGTDVTILSYGTALHRTLEAAEILEREGISAEVIDMPSLKPFDSELLIKSIKKTGAAVTLEDHNLYGGLRSIVCEQIVEYGLGTAYQALGINDVFTESGSTAELRDKYGLSADAVVRAAKRVSSLKNL